MRRGVFFGVVLAVVCLQTPANASPLIVSVSGVGVGGNARSLAPSISGDGDSVAFASDAQLSGADGNAFRDVYRYNIPSTGLTRLSVSSFEDETTADSDEPSSSRDGSIVAFSSLAPLVPGDLNSKVDIYVRNTVTGSTTRVSVDNAGNDPDGDSATPSISPDGRFVAFASKATVLVANDVNLAGSDVFVRDLATGTTQLVSVLSNGTQIGGNDPAISGNGRFVAFASLGGDIFRRDLRRRRTVLVSAGRRGAAADDVSSEPSISRSGRFVAFTSAATNLVTGDGNGFSDVFVRDVKRRRTRILSGGGNETSAAPSISADGKRVAFESAADNLVSNDGNGKFDVFLRSGRSIRRISLTAAGAEATGGVSGAPSISASGHRVAFQSLATNMPGAQPGIPQIYAVDV